MNRRIINRDSEEGHARPYKKNLDNHTYPISILQTISNISFFILRIQEEISAITFTSLKVQMS